MTPLEVTHYVPHPAIILTGCQAWPPARTDPALCPVCGRGVRPSEHATYCAVCDSMSPRNEARVRAQRLGVRCRDQEETAKLKARAALRKKAPRLSEALRRQIYNGYKGGIGAEGEGLTNLAREGREFLKSINQLPDWSVILNGRGQIVGRHRAEDEDTDCVA